MSLINESDKFFWHDFVRFYEFFFRDLEVKTIAEIGIFKGNSIRWLLERFPESTIYAADILPFQDSWPIDSRFIFSQFDQGNRIKLNDFFSKNQFDLIIEDGSHIPEHQALALLEGITSLKSSGIYILEDIHTSYFRYGSLKFGNFEFFKKQRGNALTVLLALKHYKDIGIILTKDLALKISKDSLFNVEDILMLNNSIEAIHFYRRTKLPDYCYSCGSTDFDFSNLKCSCGVEIFSDADSMSFVLIKK